MAYNPPNCGSVNFALARLVVIPQCYNVNFTLDIVEFIGLISHSSFIRIFSNELLYFNGSTIEIGTSLVRLLGSELPFQALTDIVSGESFIRTLSDVGLIRILPDCVSLNSIVHFKAQIASAKKSEPQDLPFKLGGGHVMPYGTPVVMDEHHGIPWGEIIPVDNFVNFKSEKFNLTDKTIEDGWGRLVYTDEFINTPSSDFYHLSDYFVIVPWGQLTPIDRFSTIEHGNKHNITNIFQVPYKQPGSKDVTKEVKYEKGENLDSYFSISWKSPGPNDKHQLVPWGPIDMFPFCALQYYPPLGCDTNFKLSMPLESEMIGVCYEVSFEVKGYNSDPRCPYDHHRTGRRDPYINTGIEVDNPIAAKSKEVYYMLNNVTVETVITHTPIHVLGLTATIDKQSWLWQFTLIVGTRAGLDAIKPEPVSDGSVVYKDIVIDINGWKFTCRVESWTENRSFGKDTWNVVGRSPSMELGNPQNPVSTFTYSDTGGGSSGAQIMDQILLGTMLGRDNLGWTLDWSFYYAKVTGTYGISGFDPTNTSHWGFPDNMYSWSDKTQIEALRQLTDSIGAYVQTVPDCATNKKLIVKPLFHVPPWHWSFHSLIPQYIYKSDVDPGDPYHIDHKISDSICREIGRSFVSSPSYNAVFVMGQASVPAVEGSSSPGTVLVDVYRTSGGYPVLRAPNHTDPWINSIESAGEAGRVIICNTGEWIHHSLSLFSLSAPGTESEYMPGLVLPGEYVQVSEKLNNWFGQVESTSINVSMASGAACSVVQTVEIHEYIGTKTVA